MDQSGLYDHWRRLDVEGAEDFRERALNRLVAEALDLDRPVLDVGCGAGGFVLDRLRAGQACTGIDEADEMLAIGRRRLAAAGLDPEALARRGLAEQAAAFPAAAEQVTCLDVIEHVADDAAAVSALAEILAPGGRLVLTVPARPGLYGPKDVALGHHRRYLPDDLRALFTADRWAVESLRYWNLLGVPVTWFAVKVRRRAVDEGVRRGGGGVLGRMVRAGLGGWFDRVEHRLRPPVGLTLVLVARRRDDGARAGS